MIILWLPRVRKNRTAAIEYIAEKNPVAPLKLLDEIGSQTDMLLTNPEIGRTGRKRGTRELVIGRTPSKLCRNLSYPQQSDAHRDSARDAYLPALASSVRASHTYSWQSIA